MLVGVGLWALFVAFGTDYARADDPLYERFMRQAIPFFERTQVMTKSPSWNTPESPWYPYLGRQFEAGLTEKQRAEARREAGQMNCEAVQTWEQWGFIGLYPDLIAVFGSAKARNHFETVVVPNHSLAYRRCRALVEINRYLHRKQREFPLDLDFRGGFLPVNITTSHHHVAPHQKAFAKGVRELGRLLVCHEYIPAYEDFQRLHRRFRETFFGDALARYLTLRMRQMGLEIADDNPLYLATLKRGGVPYNHNIINYIERSFATGDLDGARRVLWYQFRICQEHRPDIGSLIRYGGKFALPKFPHD